MKPIINTAKEISNEIIIRLFAINYLLSDVVHAGINGNSYLSLITVLPILF